LVNTTNMGIESQKNTLGRLFLVNLCSFVHARRKDLTSNSNLSKVFASLTPRDVVVVNQGLHNNSAHCGLNLSVDNILFQ
jgi:hypothetical protein